MSDQEKAFKDALFSLMAKHGVTMKCKYAGNEYYATDEYYFKGPNFTFLPEELENDFTP